MITDKELDSLIHKVDGAVDRQYDFIREMKGIKNYLWELKATMQESPVEEIVAPPIVETTIAPVVPEVVEEEKLTPTIEEEKLTPTIVEEKLTPAAMENIVEKTPEETVEKVTEEVPEPPIITPQIIEEASSEETAIAPQPAVEENQSYHSRKPDFEKQVDDWFKPKETFFIIEFFLN